MGASQYLSPPDLSLKIFVGSPGPQSYGYTFLLLTTTCWWSDVFIRTTLQIFISTPSPCPTNSLQWFGLVMTPVAAHGLLDMESNALYLGVEFGVLLHLSSFSSCLDSMSCSIGACFQRGFDILMTACMITKTQPPEWMSDWTAFALLIYNREEVWRSIFASSLLKISETKQLFQSDICSGGQEVSSWVRKFWSSSHSFPGDSFLEILWLLLSWSPWTRGLSNDAWWPASREKHLLSEVMIIRT